MDRNSLLLRSKKYSEELKILDKKEFLRFVRGQFQELAEKNLKIPVKLYHL